MTAAAPSLPDRDPDLAFDEQGRPFSPRYRDVYRSRAGAVAEAEAVFVDGCGLRARWGGRERFTIVELGFGLGVNFLATLAAWREDATRPARLDFVSVELHPLDPAGLARAHVAVGLDGDDARALRGQWPPRLPGLHRLEFAGGRVSLTLAIGDADRMAGLLPAAADAFYLDGFAPARNPQMWSPRVIGALARRARAGATLATYTAARGVRDALTQAGFEVRLVPGFGPKREHITARYAPRWRGHPPPAETPAWPYREAIVVGAGLAGCAVSAALARRGWRVALLERRARPGAEGSAQPALAHHLHVAPDDNPLARLSRAALLLDRLHDPTDAPPQGKLQLADGGAELERLFDCAHRLGFPESFLRAVDRSEASDLAGAALAHGGLWLPGCGAVDPLQRCHALLAGAGDAISLRAGTEVAALRREGPLWQALAADGRVLVAAPVVVLANAGDAVRLGTQQAIALRRVRGQTTRLPAMRGAGGSSAMRALAGLRTVLGGDAYACPLPDGELLVGSTFDDGDSLAPERDADLSNLRRLARMLPPGSIDPQQLLGAGAAAATGFRYTARDRMPVIGALPDEAAVRAEAEALMRNDRLPLPVQPGLYGAFAFGSRGLLWAGLAAEVLACEIDGGVPPVETDLLAATAPARFLRQQLRRRRLR